MTASDRDKILRGLDEIERMIESGKFIWRADREDVHMNIEAALTDMIGEPAKKLHTARSRNDQVVTDLRLWCRDAIDGILTRIKQLQVALVKLALKNEGLIVPGYTHLQRAQPVLLQHLLLSYVEQLERDAIRFVNCKNGLNFCPLGACALAGTGLPIDRHMTSDALGFTAPMRNSIDAVSDRDFVLEFLSTNSITAVHLSRLAEEWVLWASEEFGFLTPNDSVSTGSSIMPQKKNPDPMELVRGKSARVVASLVSLLVLCKGLPQAYNRDLQVSPFIRKATCTLNGDPWHFLEPSIVFNNKKKSGPADKSIGIILRLGLAYKVGSCDACFQHPMSEQEDKEPLFDSVKTIKGMLEVTAEFAQNITFNRERIQRSLHAGHLDATTLADYLVKKGVPFRTSHDIVGRAVAFSLSKGCQLCELTLGELTSINPVFDADVYDFLGVENSVEKFCSYGSTGLERVAAQLNFWVNTLNIDSHQEP
ncbi:argininosuccinate lyase, chloroplastic isoform X3 [Magnolia sinica]|nr:argininosuccinate lyase, chloroplastic isoform X3 [Magnolia sinica]